jgi:glycosyltransferase involved in cell wall biosynthesis
MSQAEACVAQGTPALRIVHILNHVRCTGNGIVNVAVDLACAQASAGNRVLVISGGGQYEALLADCGVAHQRFDQKKNPLALPFAAARLRGILRAFAPDVVHAHMVTGLILVVLARLGTAYRLISTVHNVHDKSANLMGFADRVIAVSQAVAVSMERRGIPERKLRVVSNGTLGSKRTRPLQAYPAADLAHPAITTVAGLEERKGIDVLIRAFTTVAARLPEPHLYIVGDGPDRAVFEREASASPAAARIHFEGFQSEPQRYLRASEIFVLASYSDSNPLVLSEAREAGCAIVASRVDGIPEALDDGEAGILVAPGDADALARRIGELLCDPVLLTRWRQRALQQLHRLRVSRVCSETMVVYTE